jgi:hypothetical protein
MAPEVGPPLEGCKDCLHAGEHTLVVRICASKDQEFVQLEHVLRARQGHVGQRFEKSSLPHGRAGRKRKSKRSELGQEYARRLPAGPRFRNVTYQMLQVFLSIFRRSSKLIEPRLR